MTVAKVHSYAYFGTNQFPVDIPFILNSAFVNAIKDHPNDFKRTYSNLNETTPDNIVNRNFGMDIYSAVKKLPTYIVKNAGDPTPVDIDELIAIYNMLGLQQPSYLICQTPFTLGNNFTTATKIINSLGDECTIYTGSNYDCAAGNLITTSPGPETGVQILRINSGSFVFSHVRALYTSNHAVVYFDVCPDDMFYNGAINTAYAQQTCRIRVNFDVTFDSNHVIKQITFTGTNGDVNASTMGSYFTLFDSVRLPGYVIEEDDTDNPYGEDGTSTSGGGDGDLPAGSEGLDFIDPTEVPELPTVSAVATGFITMYNPTSGNLSALGSFLWSGQFDLDTYKKLFADPMQGIIGLGIVPALPNSGGSRNIMFGNVDTGVNCSYLASQYAKKDCGSINIQKYVGSFMDYSPYVKISMFLPYIGFVNLGTDDIMGGSINVQYNIDVLTGDCIAFIKHDSKGVLYAYHGNCLTNVPVSGQNYANALKNYYESVAGIIPATTNGAAGGPIGAIAGAATGALNAASNVVLNSKPTFQRSGNIGGSAGILGVQKPFVIIERPNISVPNKVQHYLGQTSNITMGLGECSGLTVVEAVHLNGISATSKELAEIDTLLKGGVIL
ncbi:MAG: hypothetical protein J6S67_26725 [Methanobrevibacter sp.]|nr:hypothetical protein [Methanobrevibacter sp.]MBO7736194.1 hypothetical protein [Methanobrevibacter sp.]